MVVLKELFENGKQGDAIMLSDDNINEHLVDLIQTNRSHRKVLLTVPMAPMMGLRMHIRLFDILDLIHDHLGTVS